MIWTWYERNREQRSRTLRNSGTVSTVCKVLDPWWLSHVPNSLPRETAVHSLTSFNANIEGVSFVIIFHPCLIFQVFKKSWYQLRTHTRAVESIELKRSGFSILKAEVGLMIHQSWLTDSIVSLNTSKSTWERSNVIFNNSINSRTQLLSIKIIHKYSSCSCNE